MNLRRVIGILLLVMLSAIAVLLMVLRDDDNEGQSQTNYDPHNGMVEVMNGAGGTMWVPLYEELETSKFSADEFTTEGEYINYNGTGYRAMRGIDVSQHQGEIDWSTVKSDGVEFAYIRAGYRGYSEGGLNEDNFYRENIEGALANGISVGVYFFSQAKNTGEAVKEAQYVLSLVDEYEVSLPIYFDWERVTNVGGTRVDIITGSQMTDFAVAFCDEIIANGKSAGVYFYRSQGYLEYDLTRLSGYELWSAAPGDYSDFYYSHSMWQYAFEGAVSGINTNADLDLRFVKNEEPMPEAFVAPDVMDALG